MIINLLMVLNQGIKNMDSKEFCYWLQGYFEINGETEISAMQATVINDHLKQVFDKKTPSYDLKSVFPDIENTKFIC